MIFFPNGVSASPAILKCCLPNGIPIIVIQSMIPKNKCVRQMPNPPTIIHSTFMMIDKQPLDPPLSITLLPKGHNASIASFNVCKPKGIPIMVIIIRILEIRYSSAVIRPPKMSQIIFPKNFISVV